MYPKFRSPSALTIHQTHEMPTSLHRLSQNLNNDFRCAKAPRKFNMLSRGQNQLLWSVRGTWEIGNEHRPVSPCVSLKESVHVYKEHCRMAKEFHQVKHDIAALEERKCQLLAELVEDQKVAAEISRLEDEFRRLSEENQTLVTKHGERSRQLQRLRRTNSS